MNRKSFYVVCLSLFLLSACSLPLRIGNRRDELRGPLLVWHNWNEPESLIIEQWFQDFMTVHPHVHIVSEYVSGADFDEQFVSQIASGLGPDLIIGVEVGRLRELVDRGLLVDLTATGLDTGQVLTHAVSALQVDEQLYGLPFAAYTDVLFYNKSLVDRPPRTLDEFLQEARAGKQIALPINFQHAYWGVRAFGGSLLGEDGELASDPALVDWLDWLILAQKETVILSPDYAELKKLFAAGSAAYFIGSSIELSAFREALGEETVGVALLPYPEPSQEEAQNDDAQVELNLRQNYAGGFLELQVMAISVMSSQTDLAISVIEFFTNQTHQRELAQYDLGQIPVNLSVRFDPRFAPAQAAMIRQSIDTAIIPLRHVDIEATLFEVGTDLYSQVMEGILAPDEGFQMLSENVQLSLQEE